MRSFFAVLTVVSLAGVPSAMASDACITKDEARKLGALMAYRTVEEGLPDCAGRYPPKDHEKVFVDGALENLEKAAPFMREVEAELKEAFRRVFGEAGDRRFEFFMVGATQATRQSMRMLSEAECRVSYVGYAKIAEQLAANPDKNESFSAEGLTGELPICQE
jgi:hypothetical protein